jgi:hypothetical protein
VKPFDADRMEMSTLIGSIIEENDCDEGFFVVNIGEVISRFRQWVNDLRRVRPFYGL